MMMEPRQQIEEIIDGGSGRLRDVIVHVEDPSGDERATFDAGLAVLRNRTMASAAADVLPPSRKVVEDRARRASARTMRRASLASQLSVRSVEAVSVSQLRSQATSRIMATMKHIAPAPKHEPRVFWSSNSVSMMLPVDELAKLADMEGVAGVYPNRSIPPPRYSVYANGSGDGVDPHVAAWGIEQTGALSAWGAFGARGKGVKVAVLDTGIDPDHPDLADRIARFAEFGRSGGEVANARTRDTDKHGTHVAGTVAGGNASGRHIGMAPEAELIVGLVLNGRAGGTDAQILGGIDWAIDAGADVINLSLGGLNLEPIVTTVYQNVIVKALRAGIPVIAAIGNDGHQTSGTPGNDIFAFSVGAVDVNDRCAGFSGGRTQMIRESRHLNPQELPLVYSKPDISAPGVGVYSSVPGGKWDRFNGTSMATPHVAGAIAQLLSVTDIGSLQGAQRTSVIQDLIIGSCTDLGESGQDHRYGFGRIDIFRAIDNARRLGY